VISVPSFATSPTATATNPTATSSNTATSPATTRSGPGAPPTVSRASTPPPPVSKLGLTGNDTHSISLSWINPTDPNFAGVLIRRAAGGTPPIAASDGTLVAVLGGLQTTYVDRHLSAASTYSYAVFPRDDRNDVGIAATLTTATRSTSTTTGLRGKLTDPQGGGIGRAKVEIRDAPSGNTVAVAATAATGQFSVTGLTPGSYLVCYQPRNESTAHSSTGYRPGCHRPPSHALGVTGTPVTVLAGQVTSGLLDDPAAGGALSGRVTDSAGTGLAGVLISAFDPSTPEWGPYVALSDQDGTYTVAGLAAGSYQVCFYSQGASDASPTGYLDECYDDQPAHTTSGTPVEVSLGQTSTGVDAALAVAGAITGLVTDSSGAPVSDIDVKVRVSGSSRFAGTGRSDSNGAYTVEGLPTGSYDLCFDGSYATSATGPYGYTNGCAGDWLTADVVTGQATTFDQNVEQAGAVGGTVTGDNGPVAGVWVSVHDSSGSQLNITSTDANGSYQLNGLAPGQVTVCFEPTYTAGGYQRTCYGAQPDGSGTSSPVTVTSAVLSTADVQLQQGASITGTITDAGGAPISGVLVSAYNTSSFFGYYSQTDESGNYTFSGVTAANYQICFDTSYAQGPATGGYAAECYNHQPTIETADPVTVGSTGVVTVSTVLSPGAAITGHITDSEGTALGGVYVYTHAPGSDQYVTASSDYSDGSYRLPGLSDGDYLVCFEAAYVQQPATTGYLDECYDDLSTSSGTLVHVAAGSVQAGIDAELAVGAAITGQVTDSAGNGIPNTFINAYGTDGSSLSRSGVTDDTGHYRLTGVPATAVVVCFQTNQVGGANGTGYLDECYDNQPDVSTADPVNAIAGQVSAGIDAELADAPAA
jgi:hypothetical protein